MAKLKLNDKQQFKLTLKESEMQALTSLLCALNYEVDNFTTNELAKVFDVVAEFEDGSLLEDIDLATVYVETATGGKIEIKSDDFALILGED